jgi:hypothetical protein
MAESFHRGYGWTFGNDAFYEGLRSAILQGTEPAKVSEAVEIFADRLATELAGIVVSSRRNDPDACEQMICDIKARLVARLKEGHRG